jgi:rhodanese-related sulfurtransferase
MFLSYIQTMPRPFIDYLLVQDLATLRQRQPNLLIVDVRDELEFGEISMPGTLCMPLAAVEDGELETELANDSERPILFICAKGGRATSAADSLRDRMKNPMTVLLGGILACVHAGLPLDTPRL